MNKKTLLVTIPDGYHIRYLIDTGVITELQKAFKIILVTTPELALHFNDTVDPKNADDIKIEAYNHQLTSYAGRLQKLYAKYKYFSNRRLTGTLNIKNELQAKNPSLRDRVIRAISKTPAASGIFNYFLEYCYMDNQVRGIFKRHKPDFLLVSTPAQKFFDAPFVCYARKNGILSITPVYSWDNLTAKGPFLFNPDYLIVWNEIMKQEAVEYHNYKPEHVFVCGVPVLDSYAAVRCDESGRDAFYAQLSFQKDLPLLTITTIPQIYFGTSHLTLAKKILALRESSIPAFNLLIRPHPQDETDYSSLEGIKNVYVDNYGSKPDKSLKSWRPSKDNIEHLGKTMKYSDVVINIASTITIDAACFDTPVININYDIKSTEDDYAGSIKRYYQYTHYKKVIDRNAVSLVNNEDELVGAINHYLKEPATKREERSNLVKSMVVYTDGVSYKRIAHKVKELAQ